MSVGEIAPKLPVRGTSIPNNTMPGNVSGVTGNATAIPIVNTRQIWQAAHGFSVGQPLYYTGTTYAKAQADTAAHAEVVGMVTLVNGTNSFVLTTSGYVTGLTGLVAGSVYFLDPSVAGGMTATEPSTVGQIDKPVFVADSTTSGYFVNYRGEIVANAATITTANVKGTTTNDNAAVGYIGEFISSGVPSKTATITVTIASPAVVTMTAHGFNATGTTSIVPIVFTTTGALPTGITAGTVYYTIPSTYTTSTFQIATSVDNAIAGTAVNTSGSQSGTQTGAAGYPLTSATPANMTGISLTAGDWDVSGSIFYFPNAATTVSEYRASINTVSATMPIVFGTGGYLVIEGTFSANNAIQVFAIPNTRISISGTTTVYLVGQGTFAVNTMSGYGSILARRAR